MIYLLTAVGLTPGGNNTVHIYTQTGHSTAVQHKFTHRQYSSTAVQHKFTHRQYTVQQYSTNLHTDSTQYSSTAQIYTQTVQQYSAQKQDTERHNGTE